MPMPPDIGMTITNFKNLSDTDKNLVIWQGLMDTWTKLQETIDHQKDIEADTKVHHKLLITGNGEPSLLERMRNVEKFIGTFGYWGKVIGGALIVQTLAFFFGIVIAVVRFLPLLEQIAKNQP